MLAQGKWRENGSYLVRRHEHTCVPDCVCNFSSVVCKAESDFYSLSGLFTGLQENVKQYELCFCDSAKLRTVVGFLLILHTKQVFSWCFFASELINELYHRQLNHLNPV